MSVSRKKERTDERETMAACHALVASHLPHDVEPQKGYEALWHEQSAMHKEASKLCADLEAAGTPWAEVLEALKAWEDERPTPVLDARKAAR